MGRLRCVYVASTKLCRRLHCGYSTVRRFVEDPALPRKAAGPWANCYLATAGNSQGLPTVICPNNDAACNGDVQVGETTVSAEQNAQTTDGRDSRVAVATGILGNPGDPGNSQGLPRLGGPIASLTEDLQRSRSIRVYTQEAKLPWYPLKEKR